MTASDGLTHAGEKHVHPRLLSLCISFVNTAESTTSVDFIYESMLRRHKDNMMRWIISQTIILAEASCASLYCDSL